MLEYENFNIYKFFLSLLNFLIWKCLQADISEFHYVEI